MLVTMTMQLINKQSIERTHHSWKKSDLGNQISRRIFPNSLEVVFRICRNILPNFDRVFFRISLVNSIFLNLPEDFFES